MGFFDSFTQGVGSFFGGVGDFLTDVTGAALGAAPTVLPILQQFGVIPQIQPSPIITSRGPGAGPLGQRPGGGLAPLPRIAMPGGATTLQPISPFAQNIPFPVGFPTGRPSPAPAAPGGIVPAFQSTRGGFQTAALDLPFIDVVPQGGGSQLAKLTSPFVPTMAGARAQAFIASNPMTGALTWFKPAGKPILWSGDLTACKRVSRIARRARTASRKR